ncbi:hypothetical protein [Mycolicibacterium sp. lyk4-40-TYG-92]|uniref:hypothetical protein n=1 Tax=Mycolicibacterium sp. lyk4-40-TYG-92 TaxID=3040295 RepID=UPI00254E9209|nr:hypothetical protein [Mycolicibacterium sp. lyk4-40-TYG-92]
MKGPAPLDRPRRDVILYELNEVPWDVVDIYVKNRPTSHIAALLREGQSLTTVHEDREEQMGLQPWRTWPTLHTSTYAHNSVDLGQDPTTFKGDPIWDVAEAAGLSVGLFGPMQSWPARRFKHGGFYVPDTFSRDGSTYPPSLERFQTFNLAMTGAYGAAPAEVLNLKMLGGTAVDLLRNGLTSRTATTLATHLIKERRDPRYKAFRSAMQAPLGFDLYWRAHRKHGPQLSIFFTNHVAGLMHRFWGDGMPGYTEKYEYNRDEVYGSFIVGAMDIADHQIGRIRTYLAKHPQSMLVLAASMGQGPVEADTFGGRCFMLDDAAAFVSGLGLHPASAGLAMYPMVSLAFASEAAASAAVIPLESVTIGSRGPLFDRVRAEGRTVTFAVDPAKGADADATLQYRAAGSDAAATGKPADLGLHIRVRPGGTNTGFHIPEGTLLAAGAGVRRDPSRTAVDVLDVAPSLLANVLGVDPAPSMQGKPTLFL